MLDALFLRSRAFYEDDVKKFEAVQQVFCGRETKDLTWSVGAGFDLSIVEKKMRGEINHAFLSNTPLLMSDFHPNCYAILSKVYEVFGPRCYSAWDIEQELQLDMRENTSLYRSKKGWFINCRSYEILQMIPITIFSDAEVAVVRSKYKKCCRGATDRLVYDDWQVMYLRLRFDAGEFELLYFPLHAVIMVAEIIARFQIPLMSVLTLGSWRGGEYLGDDSDFFKALMRLPSKLKMEFVISNHRFLDHNHNFSWCAQIQNCNMGNAMIYRLR